MLGGAADFVSVHLIVPGRALAGVLLQGPLESIIDELHSCAKQTDVDPQPLSSVCISSSALHPQQCRINDGWHHPFPSGGHHDGQDEVPEEDVMPDHSNAPNFVRDHAHGREILMEKAFYAFERGISTMCSFSDKQFLEFWNFLKTGADGKLTVSLLGRTSSCPIRLLNSILPGQTLTEVF